MDACTALSYLLLGGLLGFVGQGIRVVVGLKKKYDEMLRSNKKWKDIFDAKQLWVSLLIAFLVGIIAGVLGIINYMGKEINREFLLTLIGIGYAGTDFIEGFIRKPQLEEKK